MTSLAVLSVPSEMYPLVKTGGLADVVGALPGALKEEGVKVRTLLPGYPAVMAALDGEGELLHRFDALAGGEARLLEAEVAGLDLLVLDAPHLYDRPGNPYLGPDGRDWPDNHFRYAALSRVAADLAQGLLEGYRPDVVHVHDWQTGLTPAYLHYDGRPHSPTVITVHNLAFHGRFTASLLEPLGFPPHAFTIDGVEHHGAIGFLKAGLRFADRITTVSPTYATEIMTPEHGMGLDGLLRARSDAVEGILNGLDTDVWDPRSDRLIPATYSKPGSARRLNRLALQSRFGLEEDREATLFGVVSRLSGQKGLDLLPHAIPRLVGEGGQLALIGTGDHALEAAFTAAAAAHPGRVGVFIGYDEALAHLVQAGADAFLVPSRFEPCGLTQLAALRYGAVPVVARTGGLADTIIDANHAALAAGVATGLHFAPGSLDSLEAAIVRACRLHRDEKRWRRMQRNGMASDVSWAEPARAYARLYRALARD